MPTDQWIGVKEVAAEMSYSIREAWEFIRSIGLASVNSRKMQLVRFTRAEFEEARERAKAPLPARSKMATQASHAAPKKARPVTTAASVAAKLKRL